MSASASSSNRLHVRVVRRIRLVRRHAARGPSATGPALLRPGPATKSADGSAWVLAMAFALWLALTTVACLGALREGALEWQSASRHSHPDRAACCRPLVTSAVLLPTAAYTQPRRPLPLVLHVGAGGWLTTGSEVTPGERGTGRASSTDHQYDGWSPSTTTNTRSPAPPPSPLRAPTGCDRTPSAPPTRALTRADYRARSKPPSIARMSYAGDPTSGASRAAQVSRE